MFARHSADGIQLTSGSSCQLRQPNSQEMDFALLGMPLRRKMCSKIFWTQLGHSQRQMRPLKCHFADPVHGKIPMMLSWFPTETRNQPDLTPDQEVNSKAGMPLLQGIVNLSTKLCAITLWEFSAKLTAPGKLQKFNEPGSVTAAQMENCMEICRVKDYAMQCTEQTQHIKILRKTLLVSQVTVGRISSSCTM